MDDLLPIKSPVPQIPDEWDFETEDKNFDKTIHDWRRLTGDVVSTLWIFYKKLKSPGDRTDLGQNSPRLPNWHEWLTSKGINKDTPLNHFRKFGWLPSDKPIVSLFTGDNESYTPTEYIEKARNVMGRIDLDPASNDFAQEIVKAGTYYTAEISGLDKEWKGNVWMNPPYSSDLIGRFIYKMTTEKGINQAIVLTNNNSDTQWFKELCGWADIICFTTGRINFYKSDGSRSSPTNGQTFFYKGDKIEDFARQFYNVGLLMTKYKWDE